MTSAAERTGGSSDAEPTAAVVVTDLFAVERQPLLAWSGESSLAEYLRAVLTDSGVTAGDVLVSRLRAGGCSLDGIEDAFLCEERVIRRTPVVTDAYRCGLADDLLATVGAARAHHTQLRRFELEGAAVLQVAMYPCPPSAHGVRLWCDPALVWLFLGPGPGVPAADAALVGLQSSWERVRAHHGVPFDRPVGEAWTRRYPVVDPLRPLGAHEREDVCRAVEMLVGQQSVERLVRGELTPREAVDRTLRARRDLVGHLDRLDKVLEHSHGRADTKLELLQETAAAVMTATSAEARDHFLAPHRHLVDGLKETHRQVAAAVAGASTTAALVSSAAVGRLLDRSEANRMATTAVAVAAFAIAVLTGFTALAAVPRVDRAVDDLVRLGGWLGAGSVALVAVAWALAKVAAVPAHVSPRRLRRLSGPLTGAGAGLSLLLFTLGGVSGRTTFLVLGLISVLVTAFLRAWTDDY